MKRSPARQQQSEDDALREKARQLTRLFKAPTATNDRGVERPKFLERWIASYLAELLAKEKIVTGKAQAIVRAEIASVVQTLWELQLARDALTVRVQVD